MRDNVSIYRRKMRWLTAGLGALLWAAVTTQASAALSWKGHMWNVTSGGMAGVAKGNPSNVSVDADGYLHLEITNSGGTWTAAELFTTDKLGFGTYQWQVDGPIDRFDKNIVLGLFPYGPAAGIGGDGTNEIDIEYSFWGNPNGVNGDWTNYPASGKTIGELSYTFSLNGGTLSTSRFIWSKDSIRDFLMSGLQPVSGTAELIKSWTYSPPNPTTNIPQQPLPLGMNLWCFQAPPSDGKNVEVVIRDFQFVPEGTVIPGSGGAGGMTGAGGAQASGGVSSGNGGRATSSNGGATISNGGTSTGGVTPPSNGGSPNGSGGAPATTASGATAGGAAPGLGGASSMAGNANNADGDDNSSAGCGCTVAPAVGSSALRTLLLAAPLLASLRRRRRHR